MGKRPVRRSAQTASKARGAIYIFGARPDDALGLTLKKAFEGSVFSPSTTSPPLKKCDLVIGICEERDARGSQEFNIRIRDAGVPALCVELGKNGALIGPLSLPHHSGCGHCAFARLSAAVASADHPPGSAPLFNELAKTVAPSLVREVRAIIRLGPAQSQLINHVLAIDSQSRDESLHKVIPLPHCPVCGGAAAFPVIAQEPPWLSQEDSPEVVLGALAGWVDQRTGVISNLFLEPPEDPSGNLPIIATAAPPHIMEEDGRLHRLPLGWGKGLTISGAVLSAVGEAIERYSASLPDSGRIRWERAGDLDGEFIDPRDGALYSEAQYKRRGFPFVRYDPNIQHPWVLGKWLHNGAAVWVSALDVFLSITIRQEQLICQGTSNGLAAATDHDEAALRATLELIERDAFMAAWLTGSPALRVELDSALDPLLGGVLKSIEGLGAKVELYLLPTSVSGVTIMCLGLGDGEHYPGMTFGLGADFEVESAFRQAILELGQTGPFLRRMMQSNTLTVPDKPGAVREMLQHAAYYFPRERAKAFKRLRGGKTSIALRDIKDSSPRSLAACASQLGAAGVRVALVEVTSADVATGPFRVVRAVSPDLQPIWYGYGLQRNPVERIRRLKLATGVPPINPIW
jgi:ribosomal protein S12 methylthiotransferase accessory factor